MEARTQGRTRFTASPGSLQPRRRSMPLRALRGRRSWSPPPNSKPRSHKGGTNPAEMAKNNPTGSPSPRTLAASGHADQSDRGQPISVRGRPQTHGRPAAYGSTLIITRVQKRLVRPLYILDERPQTPAVSRKAGPLCTRLSFTTVHDGRDPLLAVFDVLHVVPSLSPLPPVADRPRPLAS